MEEVFKAVPGFEGYYEASKLGNVNSTRGRKKKKLIPRNPKNVYFQFSIGGIKSTFSAAEIVMMTFKGYDPYQNRFKVYHMDRNPSNNEISNLRVEPKYR